MRCNNISKHAFRILCIAATIILISFNVYQFALDEDLARVQFSRFHSSEDRVYPATTLCFGAQSAYSDGSGSHLSKRSVLKPEFYQAGAPVETLNVEDYISKITIQYSPNRVLEFSKDVEDRNNNHTRTLAVNTILRNYAGGCFATDIPFLNGKEIKSSTIRLKKEIFTKGQMPTNNRIATGDTGFSLGLSYHNKYISLIHDNKHLLSGAEKRSCSGLSINIRGMEIIHNRNKRSHPCDDARLPEEFPMLRELSNELGCKPHYWAFSSHQPDCTPGQLLMYRHRLDDGLFQENKRSSNRSCKRIYDIWYDYNFVQTADSCDEDRSEIDIITKYDDFLLKETIMVRAYDPWSLLANIGGCIGLLLGYSILQLPGLFKQLAKNLKNLLSHPQRQEDIECHGDEAGPSIEQVAEEILSMKHQLAEQQHSIHQLSDMLEGFPARCQHALAHPQIQEHINCFDVEADLPSETAAKEITFITRKWDGVFI